MKLAILYHSNSEFSRAVDDFERECQQHTEKDIDKLDIETVEGSSLAQLYDIVSYPAILVINDDGQLYKGWQGPTLPTVEDVISNLNR